MLQHTLTLGAGMKWTVVASVANADGVYDAAYSFGAEAQISGTPENVGREVVEFLKSLTVADCKAMEYGKPPFRVVLDITPCLED